MIFLYNIPKYYLCVYLQKYIRIYQQIYVICLNPVFYKI